MPVSVPINEVKSPALTGFALLKFPVNFLCYNFPLTNTVIMSLNQYSLFDNMAEGVQVVDHNLSYLYVNESMSKQLRTSRQSILGKIMNDIHPGTEKQKIFESARNCMNTGEPCRVLDKFNFSDGTFGWYDLRMQKVDEGLLIMSFDVTELKEKEMQLRQMNEGLEVDLNVSAEELSTTNNHLNRELKIKLQKSRTETSDYKHALDESCIVAITDQKGIISYVNENFCRISMYSKEELLGQDHRIINSGFHPKEFIRSIWLTIANGKIWRGEIKNKAKDDTFYWVDTTIVPFMNETGKPYQYLAIRNDITQRKEAEEKLLRINEDLEWKVRERTLELTQTLEREKELNEMKSRFVSMASHEFRTPLSAILSSISLVDHYVDQQYAEKRKKHIDRIKTSVKNLTSILDDFLSLEKLEQGNVEMHPVNFDLRELIDDVIEEMEGMTKKKNQHILFSFVGESSVYQDKKILRNVLLNLLSNAVKYSPEEKQIFVDCKAEGKKALISVKDEGIGIPADAQKNLFDKFFRAGNVLNIQGTGLGLNIVKRYVEIIGGDIHFKSEENIGSTFFVEFPKDKRSEQLNLLNRSGMKSKSLE